jgi:hypothetical protein
VGASSLTRIGASELVAARCDYDGAVKILWALYAAGAIVAIWRTDAAWPTRLALAVLWPLGPLAFVVTVGILVTASLIAFPLVAGAIAAAVAAVVWWLVRG